MRNKIWSLCLSVSLSLGVSLQAQGFALDGLNQFLNEVDTTAYPALAPLVDNLQVQPDKDYNWVLSSYAPIHNNALNRLSRNPIERSIHLVGERLEDYRLGYVTRDAVSSGDWDTGFAAWAQLFGDIAIQQRRDAVEGYDAKSVGFAIGLDKEWTKDFWAGVGFSYEFSDINPRQDRLHNADIQSYQAYLYGAWRLTPGLYWNLMGALAYHDYSTIRFITAHEVAPAAGLRARSEAEFHGWQPSVWTEVGYECLLRQWILTPFMNYQYAHLDITRFNESKAGPYNLAIDYKNVDASVLGAGLRLGLIIELNDQLAALPQLSFEVKHDFNHQSLDATAQFEGGGNAFEIKGLNPAPTQYLLGATLQAVKQDRWEAKLGYTFVHQSAYHAHQAWLKLRLDWL